MTSHLYDTRMGIWWCLIIYLCYAVNILNALDINQFYNFGAAAGDTNVTKVDDGSSSLITLSTSFPFYGTIYTKLYVNTNGVLSFNQAFTTHTPVPFPISGKALIAVFWADVQIGIAGDIWYRETTDINTLQRATTEIQSHFTYMSSFKASMVFIATWNDVAFYGADSQGRNKRNTFQVVLTTNGYVSFVIYNYNKIQWHTGAASGGNSSTGLGGTPAEVGFNAGYDMRHHVISESMTSNVLYLPSRSNVNIAGKYVFNVSATDYTIVCENVPDVKNGLWNASSNIAGSEAQLLCKDGYLAVGDNVSYCHSDGSWIKINGSCKKLCDEVPDVENGFWITLGIIDGSEAQLLCEDGYLVIGENVSYCNSNGSWTNNDGRCEKFCENVPDVQNGLWNASSNIAGSEAQLACKDGYLAVGDNVSYCNSNGSWTKINGSCEKLCEEVPDVNNGVWIKLGIIDGSEAQLSCEEGYLAIGNNVSYCNSNGSWTNNDGRCEKLCEDIPSVQNGVWNTFHNVVGSKAFFTCEEGYLVVGDNSSSCSSNGSWAIVNGYCIKRNCTTNEDCKVVNYTYCDIVTSSCNCILGRSGISCEDKIVCENNNDCFNVRNSYCDSKNSRCQCKSGFTGNTCQNQTIHYQLNEGEKKTTVELVFFVTVSGDVEDQNSELYKNLSLMLKFILIAFYQQELPGSIFKTVFIMYVRRGSLIVTHDIITKNSPGVDVDTNIKELLEDVVGGRRNITYKNQTLPVASVTIEGTTGNVYPNMRNVVQKMYQTYCDFN